MTTERKVTVGFAIGLAFMVVLGSTACWSGWQLYQSAQLLDHAYEVLRSIEDLHIQLLGLESQVRGYALGDVETSLDGYAERCDTLIARLEQLNDLTREQPAQTERLAHLGPSVRAKIAFMDAMIETSDEGGAARVHELVGSGEGTRLMRESVELISQFEEEERKLLSDLNENALAEGVRTFTLVTCGWLIAFIWAAISGVSIHRDLSARRKMERALQDSNTAFALVNAQLEASNKQLEAFSYSVSHDLRMPLRAIEGYSQMLLEDHRHALDDEGRRLLDVVCSSAEDMDKLIQDLLEFSRLGRQPLTLQPVDMREIATQAWQEVSAANAMSAAEVAIDDLPAARGDANMLRQVLVNLLSNAAKFSREAEMPRVHVGARKENGAYVYFVEDNGCGFDMRHADKLFKVFQRLHRREEYEGSGVGLALVQNVIHRHGGTVWADAERGKGATFYFTLPAKANEALHTSGGAVS